MPDRPNLLLMMSDEHRRDAMGCAAGLPVRTPNLDALAARGALFENAYTPSPICVPARAAVATGRPVHLTGHWDSAAPWAGEPASWMDRLAEAGRPVCAIGKLHYAGPGLGFAEEILPMHVVGGGWPLSLLRDDPPEYAAAADLAEEAGPGESDYVRYDLAVTEAAERWISDPARKAAPWAAMISWVSPHYPLVAPEEFYGLYDPGTLGEAALREPDDRPAHPGLREMARFWDYDRHFDSAAAGRARAGYFGLVSFLDRNLGRARAALEATGQAGNTLVVYVSDHGEMLGDHGFWTKSVMYEASAGVPMIMAGPGVAPGRRVGTATSLLDLAPTLAAAAGADQDPSWTGTDLRALAEAPDDPDRAVFSEYHDAGTNAGCFMIRWDRWKYVAWAGGEPQLFDLAADPGEFRDLAGEAGLEDILAEGAARLASVCDPEAVSASALADQRRRVGERGGREAILAADAFGHTPVPRMN